MKAIKRVTADHPIVDLVFSLAVAALLTLRAPDSFLAAAEQDQRSIIYAAVLAAATTLLGLVSASLAIIKGVGDGPRIRVVRDRMGTKVTNQMGAAMKGLGLSSGLTLLVLLVDTSAQARSWMIFLAYVAIAIGATRLARAVWITLLILRLDDADVKFRPREPRPIRRRDHAA